MDYIKREEAIRALGDEPMVMDDTDVAAWIERLEWQCNVQALKEIEPLPFTPEPVTADDFIRAKGTDFILSSTMKELNKQVVRSEGIAPEQRIRVQTFTGTRYLSREQFEDGTIKAWRLA